MSFPGRTSRQYGNRKRTLGDKRTALQSLLSMRTKPLTPADVESIARSHGTTPAEVERLDREVRERREARSGLG